MLPFGGGFQSWLLIATNCVFGAPAAKLPRFSGCSKKTMTFTSGVISLAKIVSRVSNSSPFSAANCAMKACACDNSCLLTFPDAANTTRFGACVGTAVGTSVGADVGDGSSDAKILQPAAANNKVNAIVTPASISETGFFFTISAILPDDGRWVIIAGMNLPLYQGIHDSQYSIISRNPRVTCGFHF